MSLPAHGSDDMHVSLTKQNVADMAKRQRSRIRLLMRESEREDMAMIADALETLVEYCSVPWPIVVESKSEK